MFATDRNINWKRQFLYIPMIQWRNFSNSLVTPPVTGSPWCGAEFTANAGTPIEGGMILPYDLNPNFPVGFRVHAVAKTALTDLTSVTWTMLCLMAGPVNGTAVGTATGALDTAIAATTVSAGAGKSHYSARGIKNGGFASIEQILAGYLMQWSVVLTTSTGTISNGCILSGLMMDYVPMRTRRPHTDAIDCPQDDQ